MAGLCLPGEIFLGFLALGVAANSSLRLEDLDGFLAPFSERSQAGRLIPPFRAPKAISRCTPGKPGPLAAELVRPANRELLETHHAPDEPERRFDGLFALGARTCLAWVACLHPA